MTKISSFIIAAILLIIGTFYTVPSEARVCFATDPECGSGGNFGNMDDLKQYDDACKKYNYTYENSCPAEYIKYICPYKSTWLKCCGKQFRYEGCIYPLEIDKSQIGEVVDGVAQYGKCGTRYACKCPDEYEISSEYAETNNCQPGGGYCLQSDGTTDTVKYKTCTCDEDIYTDINSCKDNQTETSSCKDAQGTVRKKCHCDRGVYPYAECMYGPSVGANTCIDSNSRREYYSRCKTAEEACRTYDDEEDGDSLGTNISSKKHTGFQHHDCSGVRNCRSKNKVRYKNSSGKWVTDYLYSDNCVLGEQCPYPVNPGLYKCVFDKASWCTKNNYAQSSSAKLSENSTCTTPDGIQGKVVNCPANDDYSLYYYRCKITCDQRVLSKAGRSLTADPRFGNVKDVTGDNPYNGYWVQLASPKNGFHAGYHLFLRGDFRMPDAGLSYDTKASGDKSIYAAGNSSYKMYRSVNGIGALYKLDPNTYADCEDEYEDRYKNPTLTIPKHYANNILSRGLTNIDIVFGDEDDKGNEKQWVGKTFTVQRKEGATYTTWIWDNISLVHYFPYNYSGGNVENSHNVHYWTARTLIRQDERTKIRFTGNIYFNTTTAGVKRGDNSYYYPVKIDGDFTQPFGLLTFHSSGGYHILEFKDANVKKLMGNVYPDIDTSDKGAVLNIENSTVYANNIFSAYNINVNNNSTLTANAINADGLHADYNHNWTNAIKRGRQYCVGMTVRNKSTVNVDRALMEIYDDRYLYVDGGSKVVSAKPIRLRTAGRSVACIADSSSSITAKGTEYTIANGDYTKNWTMHPHGLNKNSSWGRIAYSTENNSCIPYTENKSYNSDSAYKSHCVGRYNKNNVNFMEKNSWSGDPTTHATPAMITFDGIKRGTGLSSYNGTPYNNIKSWYPRMNDSYYCRNCTNYHSCRDAGTNYASPNKYLCGNWEDGAKAEDSGPRYLNNDMKYYYYRANVSNKGYGCSAVHNFTCSGCSRCEGGVAYTDWSDGDGGL